MLRRELFGGALLLVPLLRARGESCAAADPNELGPFYRAGAPERATLCDAAEPGKRFTLNGRILGEGCAPVAGALVEVWHADHNGDYDMLAPGKPKDPGVYHLRGLLKSAADGAFQVHTIVPGSYSVRARHFHSTPSATRSAAPMGRSAPSRSARTGTGPRRASRASSRRRAAGRGWPARSP